MRRFDFGIQGVGEPPVTMFQVLITLFALGIGPVNYILLRSQKRLSWLMLTVPLGAVIVTVGLFAYAIAKDGFEFRFVRWSVTHLDSKKHHAITNARMAIYLVFRRVMACDSVPRPL